MKIDNLFAIRVLRGSVEPNVSSTAGGIFDGFEDYRTPSDDDHRWIFKAGLVVFDAKVLPNLSRFNSTTRRDLIAVVPGLGDNLWIPHQVMREFWRNRGSTPDHPMTPERICRTARKANKTAENADGCECRKLHPCRLSRMAILVDDSAEKVLWVHGEAFDLIGFDRLKPDPQGCSASE